MKKILLFCSIILTTFLSFSQDKKPKYFKFKEGEFYTTYETKSGAIDTIYINRHGNIQTESKINNGTIEELIKLKVIWVKNSTYILREYKHINNSKQFIKGDIICKIIETGDGYYIVKAKRKGSKPSKIRLDVYPPQNK